MFRRQWLHLVWGVSGVALLGCCQGCSGRLSLSQTVSVSDNGTKIVVNGQTVDLKETEKEVVRQTFQTTGSPRVIVDVFNGAITVHSGDGNTVDAEVTKTCLGETKDEAAANLKRIDVQMKQDGDTLRITAMRIDAKAGGGATIEDLKLQHSVRSADAVVRVPAGAALELKTAYGDVKVAGISGGVVAESSSGAINVAGGSGELRLTSNYGNLTIDGRNSTVTATTKSGSVKVKGAKGPIDASSGYGEVVVDGATEQGTAQSTSGNVSVKAAAGPVKLTSGYGTITIEGAAEVEADTKSGDIAVKGATGAVRAKSGYGKVAVEQAPAGATLESSSGDIRIRSAQGPVKLISGYGQIDAEVAGAVINASTRSGEIRVQGRLADGEHGLHSNYGNVTLTLPADSQFRLDARTKYGRVTTGFGIPAAGQKDDKQLMGTVGEAPRVAVTLTTDSGNIDVRKK
jgi:DUF4097 and DUF4098 domain-containing protein YvlB